MDREVRKLRDELSRKFSEIVYNGKWFSPEREFLQNAIIFSQKNVEGKVKLELFKGNISILGRQSSKALYDEHLSSVILVYYSF
jgi:argininosuccinate synthase